MTAKCILGIIGSVAGNVLSSLPAGLAVNSPGPMMTLLYCGIGIVAGVGTGYATFCRE
jgi:uncharacterized membrane protein YeaQ/YmgE (transglycosylase-associated protein family)